MGEWGREFQHQRDRVPVGETVFTSRLGITGQHSGPWLMLDAQDAAEEHGALSDRTTSRFGRRRPWLIVGSLVCMSTLVCLGIQTTVAVVALGSLVLSASFMIIGAGLSPVVPDQVPVAQRGVVLGWAGLGWAGLGWAGLGWAGLGWAGLGWAGLGWAGPWSRRSAA
ncbi:glycoside hydrolase family 36 N-terminal domain-containing protein [Streptomyces inhibens]|uniref:glycoside hydrolase family 36 N-terminal domain-containing protein n=1 Tax=Streptomyces inhibens TaxID=2293571 RepID=UPI00402AADF5